MEPPRDVARVRLYNRGLLYVRRSSMPKSFHLARMIGSCNAMERCVAGPCHEHFLQLQWDLEGLLQLGMRRMQPPVARVRGLRIAKLWNAFGAGFRQALGWRRCRPLMGPTSPAPAMRL